MCVAILVENPHPIPESDLREMDSDNPHGAGMAWPAGDRIEYARGLDVADVIRLLAEVPRPCLLHFRWASVGGITDRLTHPFPVGPDAIWRDHHMRGTADACVIHNGTWRGWRAYAPALIDPATLSDTQVAAYVAGWNESILDEVGWSNAIMRASGGGRVDTTLRGNWEATDRPGHEGNLYSNLQWIPSAYTEAGAWDWGDWDSWRKSCGLPEDPSVAQLPIGFVDSPTVGSVIDARRAAAKSAKSERRAAKRARREARIRERRARMTDPDRALDLVDLLDRDARVVAAIESADRIHESPLSADSWDSIDAAIRAQGVKL